MKQLSTAHAVLIAGILCAGAIAYHASTQPRYLISGFGNMVTRFNVRTGELQWCSAQVGNRYDCGSANTAKAP